LVACDRGGIDLPDLEVETLRGDRVNLREFKGKPLLLYIWSGTCVGHTRDLKRLADWNLGDIRVISLAIGMEREDVEKTYSEMGVVPRYITLLDRKVRISDYITLVFLPYILMYNSDGMLVKKLAKLPESKEDLEEILLKSGILH
jgi:hypothetical protein